MMKSLGRNSYNFFISFLLLLIEPLHLIAENSYIGTGIGSEQKNDFKYLRGQHRNNKRPRSTHDSWIKSKQFWPDSSPRANFLENPSCNQRDAEQQARTSQIGTKGRCLWNVHSIVSNNELKDWSSDLLPSPRPATHILNRPKTVCLIVVIATIRHSAFRLFFT